MTALALTVVLVILWGAFIAFGWWHGGWRQVVLLAAMLLSYAVLSEWAVPNGRDLSAQLHWSIARATTGVALLYLFGGTFVLGVLGSFALYRPRPLGSTERGLGAAIGALNGGLLLALVLRTLRSFAFAAGHGQALHDSALARFLIADVGYLLLIALALGGIAAVIGCIAAQHDAAREMALLASLATADSATFDPPHDHERPVASPPPLVQPPAPPPTPEPVYANAPLIDWPTSPPPGAQIAPPATDVSPKPDAPSKGAAERERQRTPLALPARPQLPPRVSPPMVYPLAALLAAPAKPAIAAVERSPASLSPSSPSAAPRAARPIGPPPGTTHPAFVPPTAQRLATSAAHPEPPRTDVAQASPLPASLPLSDQSSHVAHEADAAMPDAPPPVARQRDVAAHDVPVEQGADMPKPAGNPDETPPAAKGETMHPETAVPKYVSPPAPDGTMATAAIPKIVPPPLPPAPRSMPPSAADRPAAGEAGSMRGYARVAVARQGRADEPSSEQSPPQPSLPPEPLHPPLPTGPRVHPCATCGYPVRDHARYCPNCGSRQGR